MRLKFSENSYTSVLSRNLQLKSLRKTAAPLFEVHNYFSLPWRNEGSTAHLKKKKRNYGVAK